MKVALIQMNSQPDRAHNLAQAINLMKQAVVIEQPDLIVLPEHFDWSGGTPEQKIAAADLMPGGEAYSVLSSFAAAHGISIHAGSMLEKVPGQDKIFNTTVVFNDQGAEIGRYRKLHLFDITTPSGRRYGESDTVAPGRNLLVYNLGGFTIGAAICYDLRFSNLFWELSKRHVDVIVLPAAFTEETGRDHWETLCRSRAIEFQSYFLACGQWGPYPSVDGEIRSCFGQSLVCDPWGGVTVRAPDGTGWVTAVLDRAEIEKVRARIPMHQHRRALAECTRCVEARAPI
ncbi:carbon-nitrogen hydrolase family protein [Pelagibacterium luteolum]|uniref:Nitrilase n=1 Tax=Pelagibacterium luteolum TaxID=440168 RepID=A0A1G7ZYE5_9HYPH|nr:carbon-nitrogen hydrolase family protein [Pelagibacterium luteolum]SDH13714.1 nitrilase [Pelagibacterium luteolum]